MGVRPVLLAEAGLGAGDVGVHAHAVAELGVVGLDLLVDVKRGLVLLLRLVDVGLLHHDSGHDGGVSVGAGDGLVESGDGLVDLLEVDVAVADEAVDGGFEHGLVDVGLLQVAHCLLVLLLGIEALAELDGCHGAAVGAVVLVRHLPEVEVEHRVALGLHALDVCLGVIFPRLFDARVAEEEDVGACEGEHHYDGAHYPQNHFLVFLDFAGLAGEMLVEVLYRIMLFLLVVVACHI